MSAAELAGRLAIPTNPTVSPDVDPATMPEGEFEYANPVALNNRLLLYGNAAIEATAQLDTTYIHLRNAKLGKRKAERELEQFESRLLRVHPLGSKQSTLKAIAAHIAAVAYIDDTSDQYDELRQEVERCEDAVITQDSEVSRLRMWLDTIENAVQVITVHLSKVKADMNHHGR